MADTADHGYLCEEEVHSMTLGYSDSDAKSSQSWADATKGASGRMTKGLASVRTKISFQALDLFTELGNLEADGGLPGKTRGERFFKTTFLALAMLKADDERSGPALFTAHLKRMAAFLETFVKEFSNTPKAADTIKALVQVIRDRKPLNGDWQKEYLEYKGDDKAAWDSLSSAR